jgi:hypothetical protein
MDERRWRVSASGTTDTSWPPAAVAEQDRVMSDWARKHPGAHLAYERHSAREVFISVNVSAPDTDAAVELGEALITELVGLLPGTHLDALGALPVKAQPDFT